MLNHIVGSSDQAKFLTQKEILNYIEHHFGKSPTSGWFHSFTERYPDIIKIGTSLPQEDRGLTVPRIHLEEHIRNLKKYVEGAFADLVFNLDEVGSSDWEDKAKRQVYVHVDMPDQEIRHPVSRRFGHMTLVACISAGGDALIPMLIVKQAIPEEVYIQGLRPEKDVRLRRRDPAYIDEALFYEYVTSVFIPYVNLQRHKDEYRNAWAVLLMDSVRAHVSNRILQVLGENQIIALTFPSHTSNLFQALDLGIFDQMKTLKKTAQGDSPQINSQDR